MCSKSLELLEEIRTATQALNNKLSEYVGLQYPMSGYRGRRDGYDYDQVGASFFFKQTVTLTGSAQSIDLNLPRAFQLNRIEQIFSDGTAKDYTIEVFSDPSASGYANLKAVLTDTTISHVLQLGSEYKFPGGSRVRIAYANTTAAKTVAIRIQVDEL